MKKIKYFLDNMIARGTKALMVLLVFISLFFVLTIGSIAYTLQTEMNYFLQPYGIHLTILLILGIYLDKVENRYYF